METKTETETETETKTRQKTMSGVATATATTMAGQKIFEYLDTSIVVDNSINVSLWSSAVCRISMSFYSKEKFFSNFSFVMRSLLLG